MPEHALRRGDMRLLCEERERVAQPAVLARRDGVTAHLEHALEGVNGLPTRVERRVREEGVAKLRPREANTADRRLWPESGLRERAD